MLDIFGFDFQEIYFEGKVLTIIEASGEELRRKPVEKRGLETKKYNNLFISYSRSLNQGLHT